MGILGTDFEVNCADLVDFGEIFGGQKRGFWGMRFQCGGLGDRFWGKKREIWGFCCKKWRFGGKKVQIWGKKSSGLGPKNGDLGAKVPMLGTLKRHILFLEFFRRDLS